MYPPSQKCSPSISTAWQRCGRHVDASTCVAQISSLVNTRTLPVRTLVAHRNSLIAHSRRSRLEVDDFFEQRLERIVVAGIEMIGREHPRHEIEESTSYRHCGSMEAQESISCVVRVSLAFLDSPAGPHHGNLEK